jgi:hypothetical protein
VKEKSNRIFDVRGIEPSGEKYRFGDAIPDATAQSPVMGSAGSSQLCTRQRWIAGVQKDGGHLRSDRDRLIYRVVPDHVNDLDDSNSRQATTKLAMRSGGKLVNQLKGVDSGFFSVEPRWCPPPVDW